MRALRQVMRDALWTENFEGMMALVGEDNFDAGTDLGVSEIEILSAMKELLAQELLNSGPDKNTEVLSAHTCLCVSVRTYAIARTHVRAEVRMSISRGGCA